MALDTMMGNKFADLGNQSVFCHESYAVTSKGIFYAANPLKSSVPLLLIQLSLIFATSRLFEVCLKPLGQSSVVGQILGGMALGPSLLGRSEKLSSTFFPKRGAMVIETVATFGIMFFNFEMGLKMDANMMIRPGRMAMLIGGSVFIFSAVIPLTVSAILKKELSNTIDPTLDQALPIIALLQSVSAFQVIACLLTELKILNTEVGRLALASSMFSDLIGVTVMAMNLSYSETHGKGLVTFLGAALSTFALLVLNVYGLRLIIMSFLRSGPKGVTPSTANVGTTTNDYNYNPSGVDVSELQIFVVFLSVLVSGLLSEIVGQHYALGPLLLGLALPDGPPYGSVIVQKLDTMIQGILYPTFIAVSGLKMNIFALRFEPVWVIGVVVLVASIVKVVAAMVPIAAFYGDLLPVQDAFVLGLVMNAKGYAELMVYNLLIYDGTLTDQEFTVCMITVVIVSAAVTPLIKVLYTPHNHYIPMKRTTIQHHNKRESELTILVCIHNHDNIPTTLNLLEASTSSPQTPISIIAVFLVELIGRTTPMFVPYQSPHNQPQRRILRTNPTISNYIVNAFKHYENHNQGTATVQLFTNMSHYDTMHDSICRVALDRRVNILIVPFHKQWGIDGTVESCSPAIQGMNIRLLEKAPCSIGLLIDRGPMSGSLSLLNNNNNHHRVYNVAVVFIGGADDAESLAYGSRMSRHERVVVTVFRFLHLGSDNSRERKHDSDLIEEYRRENVGNENFEYVEEVVRDGVGLAEAIRGIGSGSFDLIIVGRNHMRSQLLFGLDQWSECPELGVIGDMFAAPESEITASVLVVQQQRMTGNAMPLQNDVVAAATTTPDNNNNGTAERMSTASRHPTLSIAIDRIRSSAC